MSSMSIALITFGCIFGGAIAGMVLSMLRPNHHLISDSKDSVKMAAGIVATMAALVLGLLVGSSRGFFDIMNSGITQIGAKVIILDRTLARTHAKSGDAATISGYLGKSDVFDQAIGTFALAYADQTVRDHGLLVAAVKTGRIEVKLEEE